MIKQIITAMTFALALLTANVAFSHGSGHGTPPTSEQVIAKASMDLGVIVDKAELVEGKTLDASWKNITVKKIHKKTFKYYVVSFAHEKEKRTLYILLNTQGAYLGANFDGQFKQL